MRIYMFLLFSYPVFIIYLIQIGFDQIVLLFKVKMVQNEIVLNSLTNRLWINLETQ